MSPKRYILLITSLWCCGLFMSLFWNIRQNKQSAHNEHLQTARAFFQQILISRAWNAAQKGVYLYVTKELQPNPYLHTPNRDLTTQDGVLLTQVNPASMTRLIADIAEKKGPIKFHITSLKPINPKNAPFAWEKSALQSFDNKKLNEFSEYHLEDNKRTFRYIAPLVTEGSCLQCHKQQGYKISQVRGGISVSFVVPKQTYYALIYSHILLLLVGIVVILGFGYQIVYLTEISF